MEKKSKFYEFKNLTGANADLYIYGEIISGEKWYEDEVNLTDFQDQLNTLSAGSTLNMYVNSPGGSVFAASTMASMLKRAEEKGITVNAYVDGLAASAASFLIMAANTINIYKNSMVMIHKPMSLAYGNAEDFKKQIDVLDKIEENTMMPLYMDKCKKDEDTLKNLIAEESWLGAEEIQELFNVTLLEEEKEAAACSSDLFKNYKNTPKNLIEKKEESKEKVEKVEETKEVEKVIDYSIFENRLKALKERK